MGHYVYHLKRVHPLDGRLTGTLQAEGYHSARAIRQIFLSQLVVGVVFQPAIVHPCHLVVVVQELGHLLGILAVLGHAQVQRLQTHVEQEGVLRSGYGAQVAHELCHELGGISHLAECLNVCQAVIRLVGRAEAGEAVYAQRRTVGNGGSFVGACLPIEVTAVHHTSSHLCSHAVHIFRGAVGHDVGSPLEGSAVDRRGKGVVDNQGNTVTVGNTCETLNIEDGAARVGDGLAKHGLGVGTEGCLYLLVGSLL